MKYYCKSMGIYHATTDAERYQNASILLLFRCACPNARLDAVDRPSSKAKPPRLKPGLRLEALSCRLRVFQPDVVNVLDVDTSVAVESIELDRNRGEKAEVSPGD
jgi:hypothetical protein